MRGREARGYLTAALILAATTTTFALSPHDKAIGVQPEQKTDRAIHAQEQTQANQGNTTPTPAFVTPPQPASQQGDASQHRDSGEQEGTEFWPTFMGYKFKITDSLIALSTLALTVFTGLLWRSTEKLWDAGERQIALAKGSADLARLALEAAETPYLVPIVRAYDERLDPAPPSPAMQPLVSLRFENVGRSPATVLEIRYDTYGSNRTPDPVCFPPLQTNLRHSYILAPGRESDPVRFTVDSFNGWAPSNQHEVAWINGHVRYADVFGNHFLTGFCYYRNGWGHGWHAQGGPGHNYRRKLTGNDFKLALRRDGPDAMNIYPGG